MGSEFWTADWYKERFGTLMGTYGDFVLRIKPVTKQALLPAGQQVGTHGWSVHLVTDGEQGKAYRSGYCWSEIDAKIYAAEAADEMAVEQSNLMTGTAELMAGLPSRTRP